MQMAPSPEYVTNGPYRLVSRAARITILDLTLEEAVVQFRRQLMPVAEECEGGIVDEDGVITLGYGFWDGTLEWFGVREALELFRDDPLVEPLDWLAAEQGIG